MTVRIIAIGLAALLLAGCSKKPKNGPPEEAVKACASLSEGATCKTKMGDKEMEGTCQKHPGGDKLACSPKGGPRGPGGPKKPGGSEGKK